MKELPDITEILRSWSGGNEEAADRLLQLVYEELRHWAEPHAAGTRRSHNVADCAGA